MNKCLYAAVGLMLTVVVAACGGGSKGSTGTGGSSGEPGSSKSYAELRWGLVTFPGALDWNKNPWNQLIAIEQLAVQNLVEFEPSGKLKLGVASSVEHPNDTTYIYHLKSEKFSDGKPLTSADVVYSLRRNMIGKEVFTKTYWEDVASVSPQGESTVVVKLKRPSAVFQDVLAFTGQVIEKAQAERVGEKALGTPGNLPIGTGPWKLDSFQEESGAKLSRNPYWTGQPQPAEKISVSLFKDEASMGLALRSGAIDGTFNYLAPKIFEHIPGVRQLKAPGTGMALAGMDTVSPPFSDVHVRRAVAYAIDSQGIINALYPGGGGVEDVTVFPSSLFAAGPGTPSQVEAMLAALPHYKFDLAAAKKELAKSAYPHGFTTTVQSEATTSTLVAAAQVLAADLNKIGIKATVQEIPPDESPSMCGKNVNIYLTEWYAAYTDPEGILSSILPQSQIRPTNCLNYARYKNAEVDRLQPEEAETVSQTKRLQLLGKMLATVGEEAPYRPLFTHATFGAISEKYVFPTFSEWTASYKQWALDVKLAH